jgi:hypothetical protein
MKKLILASAFAAALAIGIPMGAEAKTMVYMGVPHYGYQVGPDYRFRQGYGWYQDSDYYNNGRYNNRRGRLSCGEARSRVRNSGFRNVSTIECQGRTYTFEGTRRGRDATIYVNSRTGAVWRG